MAKEQTTTIIDGAPRRLISQLKAKQLIDEYVKAVSIPVEDSYLYFETVYVYHNIESTKVFSKKKGERYINLDTITISLHTNLPEHYIGKIKSNLMKIERDYRRFLSWEHNGLKAKNYIDGLTWTIPIVITKAEGSFKEVKYNLK